MEFNKCKKASTQNSFGKVNAKTAKKIETALYKLAAEENLDVAVVKLAVNTLVDPYASKGDAVSVQFMKDTIDLIGEHAAQSITEKSYDIELTKRNITTDIDKVFDALKQTALVIPMEIRAAVLHSAATLNKIKADGRKFFSAKGALNATTEEVFTFGIQSKEFANMYSLFKLAMPGGITASNALNTLNGIMTTAAVEIHNDSTITQLFDLVSNDLSTTIELIKSDEEKIVKL